MALCIIYNDNQILGVFLYGSQNYGLDTENSDVDTKAIYIPTLEELMFKKPISKELELPDGSHCDVKDIREIIKNFTKQNINYIEILYTKYYYINGLYEKSWKDNFIVIRDCISHYDMNLAIKASAYQGLSAIKDALKPDKDQKAVIKSIANAFRLLYFIESYVIGEYYLKCIQPENDILETIMDMKTREEISMEELSMACNILQPLLQNYATKDFSALIDAENQKMVYKIMSRGALEMANIALEL